MRKRSPSSDYFCVAFVAALAYFESFAHISLFRVCQVVTFTKRIQMAVLFWIFSIRSVQNGSILIKLDQIGFLTNQKMFL